MSWRRVVLGLGLVFAGGVVCGEASLSGLTYLWWVGGGVIAPGAVLVLGSVGLSGRSAPSVLGSSAVSGKGAPVEEQAGPAREEETSAEEGRGAWRLGELLVHYKFISEAQLTAALARQREGNHRRLGEILVEMGLITPAWLTQVLEEQAAWSGGWRVGE
jgi:hypothetical protein